MNKLVGITFCAFELCSSVTFGSYNSYSNQLQKAYFDLLHQNNEVSKSDKDSLSSNSLSSEQSYFQNDANEDSEDMNLFEKQQPSYEDRNAASQMAFDALINGDLGQKIREAANNSQLPDDNTMRAIKIHCERNYVGFQDVRAYLMDLISPEGNFTSAQENLISKFYSRLWDVD